MTAIKRVAILFAGGPAPAANSVITSAAFTLLNAGVEVFGIKHGYSNLIDFDPKMPLVEGQHYLKLSLERLEFSRTEPGIMIGTARIAASPNRLCSATLEDHAIAVGGDFLDHNQVPCPRALHLYANEVLKQDGIDYPLRQTGHQLPVSYRNRRLHSLVDLNESQP